MGEVSSLGPAPAAAGPAVERGVAAVGGDWVLLLYPPPPCIVIVISALHRTTASLQILRRHHPKRFLGLFYAEQVSLLFTYRIPVSQKKMRLCLNL